MTAADSARTDRDYAWSLFERFVAADTSVRPMETFVRTDDPRVAAFAHDVAAPALRDLGANVSVDGLNNVVARFGPVTGREVMLVSYPVTHHANRLSDPLRAMTKGSRWIGLGASQGKAGLAAACAAARRLIDGGHDLAGRALLAVCSEGSSTHSSSRALYETVGARPAAVVLTIGTENRMLLGNRGRVDVYIDVPGRSTHSSSPELGDNPIPRVGEVLQRVPRIAVDGEVHPLLGRRHLVPYSVVCEPIAPHTLPERCRIKLDRRLLPGDSPQAAVDEVAAALAGLRVDVSMGPLMLPALTPEDDPLVVTLRRAAEGVTGRSLPAGYATWTFDAGYPSSLELPTVMFGPSAEDALSKDLLDDDYVEEQMVMEAAAVYESFMMSEL